MQTSEIWSRSISYVQKTLDVFQGRHARHVAFCFAPVGSEPDLTASELDDDDVESRWSTPNLSSPSLWFEDNWGNDVESSVPTHGLFFTMLLWSYCC